jgi:hypothetical protein
VNGNILNSKGIHVGVVIGNEVFGHLKVAMTAGD